MYTCEICGFEVDEIEDIARLPTPSLLDPEAVTDMCRDCARESGVDVDGYFTEFEDDDEDLDPLYLEEIGFDELD